MPEGGGPATQELDAAPGGSKVDEAVVLGTPEGVYRFTVARPKGGALTVEAAAMARVPLAGTNYIPGQTEERALAEIKAMLEKQFQGGNGAASV